MRIRHEGNRERTTIAGAIASTLGAALLLIGTGPPLRAIPVVLDVDLDGTQGSESSMSLELGSTSPTIRVRNRVVNKAVGQAFTFNWYNAGPGGFLSSVGGGTCTGVGTQWDWETTSVIYTFTGSSCETSVCLSRTSSTPPVSLGPFPAPGRSLTPAGVTLSAASLTASLITFFSPPTELVRATSSVQQLTSGRFRYRTRVLNLTPSPITYDLGGVATGEVVPPGGAREYCQVSPFPAKEEKSLLTVCGSAIPDGPPGILCSTGDSATRGSFGVLAADPSSLIGSDPFLTPFKIVASDADGDGIAEPGETVSLTVLLLNAGPIALVGVNATLSSPPIDLTLDATVDPVAVSITTASSAYPDIPGTPATTPPPGDCATGPAAAFPVANIDPFVLSVPPDHPGGVGRPFNLHVTGSTPGGSFQMDVPFVLPIGANCTPP